MMTGCTNVNNVMAWGRMVSATLFVLKSDFVSLSKKKTKTKTHGREELRSKSNQEDLYMVLSFLFWFESENWSFIRSMMITDYESTMKHASESFMGFSRSPTMSSKITRPALIFAYAHANGTCQMNRNAINPNMILYLYRLAIRWLFLICER